MARETDVRVNLLGDDTDLAKATRRAERRLESMRKKLKTSNKALRGLFKGIGVGAAIAAISKFTKAADSDNKSLANLAVVTHNLTGATAAQIKAVDAQIQSLQYVTGLADDDLRPAFLNLLVPLKDSQKAMSYLGLAADVAAGRQKDLSVVSLAMAKALGGNATALNKLVPGISAAANPMQFLIDGFKGAASAAVELSPYQQMSVIFNDIAEQLGTAFLPLLRQFADYLTSPDGKAALQDFVTAFTVLATGVGQIAGFLGMVVKETAKFLNLTYDVAGSVDVVKVALDSAERGWTTYGGAIETTTVATKKQGAAADSAAKKEKARLAKLVQGIQGYAKEYRDAIDFSLGLNDSGTRFRADRVIAQMQKVLDFAKKLPAKLKALAKGGATKDTLARIAGLGPTEGYAVASGLLESGQLGTFNKLTAQLGQAGQRVGLASNAAYTININKANMTSSEIVAAIKSYERSTGRKLLLNG